MAKGPAELEFKKNKKLSWSQQMGVAVSLLVEAGHEDWIKWIISVSCVCMGWTDVHADVMQEMELALAAREEVVLAVDEPRVNGDGEESEEEENRPRNFVGPSMGAIEKFTQYGE
jgi:replication fork protection complex subunit Tof1/Swi1